MNYQIQAIHSELQKLKHLKITGITFAAFSLAPLMGGVVLIIMKNPGEDQSLLSLKAQLMSLSLGWRSYLLILSQAVGVGGVLLFGFVASWIFGREYSDGTAKDLLALPTSRTTILNAKFFCYVLWCLALALSNLILGFIIGSMLDLPALESDIFWQKIKLYFITTLLTIPLGSVVALFALAGKGYMAPLGLVALTLVLAQILAAVGFGHYFPWSIPGLYSMGGEFKKQLDEWSYSILAFTSIAGYLGSILWWRFSDQTN